MSHAGDMRTRKMFGEYALYCDDKVIAFICDDQLYLKITEPGRTLLKSEKLGQAYSGSKDYFVISPDDWDDRDYMIDLARTTADALPMQKLKNTKH